MEQERELEQEQEQELELEQEQERELERELEQEREREQELLNQTKENWNEAKTHDGMSVMQGNRVYPR